MSDLLDTLLFEDPSPEERDALLERLEEEPELAEAWAHWREVRMTFRDRLQERVSDRRLLVLYVLDNDGYDEALSTAEQAALEAARSDIAHAIDTIPALTQVVERIREERTDFEAVWSAAFDDDRTGASDPDRTDRAARPPSSQDTSFSRWSRRFALASLVIGIAIGIGVYSFQETATKVAVVDEGEVRTVELGTGSTARLVGAARLSYPTSDGEGTAYEVTLEEGRAFFDVQRRSDENPFVVETPSATASVLGTQFGVVTRADTTEVVLASGAVRVAGEEATDPKAVVLKPGQKSRIVEDTGPSAPISADLTAALDWAGLLVFRSTPMKTVADRLSRRYDVSITVEKGLLQEPVTGTFEQDQPAEQVLGALAATLGAEVTRRDDAYRIVSSR